MRRELGSALQSGMRSYVGAPAGVLNPIGHVSNFKLAGWARFLGGLLVHVGGSSLLVGEKGEERMGPWHGRTTECSSSSVCMSIIALLVQQHV